LAFPGSFTATCTQQGSSRRIQAHAECKERIRAVKVRLHQLPEAAVFQTGWNVDPNGLPIVAEGVNFSYPEYQGGMPAWMLAFGTGSLGVVSMDPEPRPKRFTAYKTPDDRIVDLTYEEDARRFTQSIDMPPWDLLPNASLEQVIAHRVSFLEKKDLVKQWQARIDVPAWSRDVKLVITLHGMHWSGFVFNDYKQMLGCVDWVTQYIPGKNVLVFLAGWEGRYYRKYGDSRADPRMGGEQGLRALVQGIHQRGAHVMPMYSGNYPQQDTPHYDDYAPQSRMMGTDGFRWDPMRGYVVDWGQLRGSGMSGGGPSLNIGAPAWRDYLVGQVSGLNDQYKFDGSYFDTQPPSDNDARYNPLDGFRQLALELRSHSPELLISSESWFDLSLGFVPWSQTPGGPQNWTHGYQRRFAHLSMGEPSRGSTGVHELGHIPYNRKDLDEMFDIPTLAFVDGTIENAASELKRVIGAARMGSPCS
jgi:hypothetical protein